ncbi:MAG: hypothetical protein C6W58_04915 [Bacillaceae bacterium]|jgi:CBS domain-containing protein|nr:MAG: hypothetical protein C6W58_04915 [Bacillaceae bacterium]
MDDVSSVRLFIKKGIFIHMGNPYKQLKEWRNSHLQKAKTVTELNSIHDQVMKQSFHLSFEIVKKKYGPAPCEFTWFLVGSGGRGEQAKISDQDHGLIFHSNEKEALDYFLLLGKEVSFGLNVIGYPYCEGNVMCSTSLWCRSEQSWSNQINKWLQDETFDSIRYLLIFFDARMIIGQSESIHRLKNQIFQYIQYNPDFLGRLLNNTMHVKKGVGIFHQLLPETYGPHSGAIDLKQAGLLPYINSVRLLAIKERLLDTSTLSRFQLLMKQEYFRHVLSPYHTYFQELVTIHFKNSLKANTYDEVHYLSLKDLSKEEKGRLKKIILGGKKLMNETKSIIEKGVNP